MEVAVAVLGVLGVWMLVGGGCEVANGVLEAYCDFAEHVFDELLVVYEALEDFLVVGDVDEHREGILRDRCVVFDQQFKVGDGLELVALEEAGLSAAVSDQVFGG